MQVFYDERKRDCFFLSFFQSANNQKFGLIEALIRIGDWSHAKKIMDRLPAFSAVSYPPVAQAVCKLLHHSIDQLYQKYAKISLVPLSSFLKNSSGH